MRKIFTLCAAILTTVCTLAQVNPERLVIYSNGNPARGFLSERIDSVKVERGTDMNLSVYTKDGQTTTYKASDIQDMLFERVNNPVKVDTEIKSTSDNQVNVSFTRSEDCASYKYAIIPVEKLMEFQYTTPDDPITKLDEAKLATFIESVATELHTQDYDMLHAVVSGLEAGKSYSLVTLAYDKFNTPCRVSHYNFTYLSNNFRRRCLVNQYTGTWCPNCPRVSIGIYYFKKDDPMRDDVVFASFHSGDKMETAIGEKISGVDKNWSGYPGLTINLEKSVKSTLTDPVLAAKQIRIAATAALKTAACTGVSASVSKPDADGNITIDADILVAKEGSFRVAAWVIEDDIYAPQQDKYNYQLAYNYDTDMHHNVFCGSTSAFPLGDELDTGKCAAGSRYKYQKTINIKNLVSNYDKTRVAVVVTWKKFTSSSVVDNVIECNLGETKLLEHKP